VLSGRVIGEYWIGKDVEGSNHGIIWSTVLALARRDWGILWKIALRLTILRGRDLIPESSEYAAI
jgi:hypothetical protein